MKLIDELKWVWEPIEWPERNVLILLGLFGAIIIGFLIIAKFHGHVFSTRIVCVDPNNIWPVNNNQDWTYIPERLRA